MSGRVDADGRLTHELGYKLLRLLEDCPALSQRDVARELDISLGKVNYCLRALARMGWIKVSNFKNSRNKAAYRYLLTPHGIKGRTQLTARFLRSKLREYDRLRAEIESIKSDLANNRLR